MSSHLLEPACKLAAFGSTVLSLGTCLCVHTSPHGTAATLPMGLKGFWNVGLEGAWAWLPQCQHSRSTFVAEPNPGRATRCHLGGGSLQMASAVSTREVCVGQQTHRRGSRVLYSQLSCHWISEVSLCRQR